MLTNTSNQAKKSPIITIDGPSGAGKGTASLLVARHLGWNLLDSGALYRLTALAALKNKVDFNQVEQLAELAQNLDVIFQPGEDLVEVILQGEEVSNQIRTEEIGGKASQLAALPEVRSALMTRLRAFAQPPGLVCDGRDMGTIVFPEAELKIYLTASAEERAKRRLEQLRAKGVAAKLCDLKNDIQARDERDFNRADAPLIAAAEAIELDSTQLSLPEVVTFILAQAEARGLLPKHP